mmetsp:Transcript_9833/g.13643  ORF Transcript_9833/g.13643 Transcript_9833/m.13643 type:complete len:239 (+) Transcript_9833:56-772(+)
MEDKTAREDNEWLPVESSPQVLTDLARSMGVDAPWGLSDVYGLDQEVLAMVPQPVGGLLFLFPSKNAPARQLQNENAPASTFYMQQLDDATNACGTVALLHCIGNTADLQPISNSPLDVFLRQARILPDPYARGCALVAADDLRQLSNAAARRGETSGAGTSDNQDQHYLAFVCVDNTLIQLDGRHLDQHGQAIPVVHGRTTRETLLSDAATIIKRDFVSRDPSNLNFSLLAFCQLPS